MKNTLTFDDIIAAEDEQYQGLDIPLRDGSGVATLRTPLFLSKDERKALSKAQEEFNEADDVLDVYQSIIRIAIGNDEVADRLFADLGESLPRYQKVFNTYSKDLKAGEASSSQN